MIFSCVPRKCQNIITKYGVLFGPTNERDGTWRIKTNDKLDKLIRHKNIINYIKAERLGWFGHLHRLP